MNGIIRLIGLALLILNLNEYGMDIFIQYFLKMLLRLGL